MQPTGVRFGTSGRNIVSGPGLFALNLALFKSFRVKDRLRGRIPRRDLQLHEHAAVQQSASTSLTSSTYGYVTGTLGSGTGVNGTGGGRAVQLGVKLSF